MLWTRRDREIGIRTALGANPRHLLGSIFSRAARQIGAGLAIGVTGAALLDIVTSGRLLTGPGALTLPFVALLIGGTGLLAALGPARQGLRVTASETLRADG
jgi:putative ABC transport system permease protein